MSWQLGKFLTLLSLKLHDSCFAGKPVLCLLAPSKGSWRDGAIQEARVSISKSWPLYFAVHGLFWLFCKIGDTGAGKEEEEEERRAGGGEELGEIIKDVSVLRWLVNRRSHRKRRMAKLPKKLQ